MALQKLVCSQCGSNEIRVVASTVFECESCGTLLNEKGEAPRKPFRSKRVSHAFEDPEFASSPHQDHHEAGSQFLKMVFWIAVLTGTVMLVVWVLN